MTFSIFNSAHFNVEAKTFDSAADAKRFMKATDYSEFGKVHVGQNCELHDEGEAGKCPFCELNRLQGVAA